MGEIGRKWMERDFAWSNVSEKMIKTYNWLLYEGVKPDWVITD